MRFKQLLPVPPRITAKQTKHLRTWSGIVLLLFTFTSITSLIVIKTKEYALNKASHEQMSDTSPFPISVDPHAKTILDEPIFGGDGERHIASFIQSPSSESWWGRAVTALAGWEWYQGLASPSSRILVIRAGERKEEIVDSFGDILRWDTQEREHFAARIATTIPKLSDGKFFPEHYVVHKDAGPEEVAHILIDTFNERIGARYTDEIKALVPMQDALTIASLLEREANDFEDMRNVSGVIWNRLFVDMKLQLDASLQYVKGSRPYGPWWPRVFPADKFLSSPYNTYQHKGLPPTPIGNPSVEAVLAALNPKKSECMYYFHDARGTFHCTNTYEEHVELLRQYYGRGR